MQYLKLTCRHLGKPTGKSASSSAIPRAISLPILSCELHGKCTWFHISGKLACCHFCRDWDPRAIETPDGQPVQ